MENELWFIYFTRTGERIASRIAENSHRLRFSIRKIYGSPLAEIVEPIFKRGNVLVFIGAIGIAVRAIAPLIESKATDPAVIVVDELGKHVIPILSGHIGGANRTAKAIAEMIGATAIITTSTDVHGVFSVDSYAVENGYTIVDPAMIKIVSTCLLNNDTVSLSSVFPIEGKLPMNIVQSNHGQVGIHIGKTHAKPFAQTLVLLPKCFHVGIGCKRGTSFDTVHEFFLETLEKCTLLPETVGSISSIDLKRDEQAIIQLADLYAIPFRTYSAQELRKHEHKFETSDFVRDKTGVGNVCEIAAWVSSKEGKIVCGKTARNGVTLAVVEEDWIVSFAASTANFHTDCFI